MTPAQASALDALAPALPSDAYLAGGLAVAAHFRHRQSIDLDIFMGTTSPEELACALEGTPELQLRSRAAGTVHATVRDVPVSLLRYGYPLLAEPKRVVGFAIPIASVPDLICMKLSAIAGRGALRDFWDLHVLLTGSECSLAEALDLYRRKYPIEDVGHVVKSLVYFGDADREPMPVGLSAAKWKSIKAEFAQRVTSLVS